MAVAGAVAVLVVITVVIWSWLGRSETSAEPTWTMTAAESELKPVDSLFPCTVGDYRTLGECTPELQKYATQTYTSDKADVTPNAFVVTRSTLDLNRTLDGFTGFSQSGNTVCGLDRNGTLTCAYPLKGGSLIITPTTPEEGARLLTLVNDALR